MRKVLVKCTYSIEIEVPDDTTDDKICWDVQSNGCPGTGLVGAAFDEVYKRSEKDNTCWSCELNGESKVIKIT